MCQLSVQCYKSNRFLIFPILLCRWTNSIKRTLCRNWRWSWLYFRWFDWWCRTNLHIPSTKTTNASTKGSISCKDCCCCCFSDSRSSCASWRRRSASSSSWGSCWRRSSTSSWSGCAQRTFAIRVEEGLPTRRCRSSIRKILWSSWLHSSSSISCTWREGCNACSRARRKGSDTCSRAWSSCRRNSGRSLNSKQHEKMIVRPSNAFQTWLNDFIFFYNRFDAFSLKDAKILMLNLITRSKLQHSTNAKFTLTWTTNIC